MTCEYYGNCEDRKDFLDSGSSSFKKWESQYCKREGNSCSTRLILNKRKNGVWDNVELLEEVKL